jgi:hypothetical protein
MTKTIILFLLLVIAFLHLGCKNRASCAGCSVSILVYDSTRFEDFLKERGSGLVVDKVYPDNTTPGNLIFATVYVVRRAATGDTVLIVSPNDKEKINTGARILLDTIEKINVGDKIEIQLPQAYLKFTKDRSTARIARAFVPTQ